MTDSTVDQGTAPAARAVGQGWPYRHPARRHRIMPAGVDGRSPRGMLYLETCRQLAARCGGDPSDVQRETIVAAAKLRLQWDDAQRRALESQDTDDQRVMLALRRAYHDEVAKLPKPPPSREEQLRAANKRLADELGRK